MDKQALFPVHLYRHDLADAESMNQLLRNDILAWQQADPKGNPRSTGGTGWHSHNASQRPAFQPLVQAIVHAATEVVRAERYRGTNCAVLKETWANINPVGGFNRPHSHGGEPWAGVYHVDAPPGSPPTSFLCPYTSGREAVFHEQAVPGRMLIFPGWLNHYVDPHPNPLPRISVSFNLAVTQPAPPAEQKRHFVEVPQLLSRDEVIKVYTQLAGHSWAKGLVGNGRESPNRINKVLFADGKKAGSKWRWLYDKIVHHAGIVNAETFKVDISGGGDIQFARYGDGGKYDVHEDRGPGRGSSKRTLSCSIVLRPAERGGGISFPNSPIQPEHQSPGDAVFFAATEPHAALPVKEGVRDSLIVWLSEK